MNNMTERNPMESISFVNASEEEDPIILAKSYMMYKIGKFVLSICLHKYFGQIF